MDIQNATQNDLPYLYDLWQERLVIIGQIDVQFAKNQLEKQQWLKQAQECLQQEDWAVIAAQEDSQPIGYIAGMIFKNQSSLSKAPLSYGIIEVLVLDAHTYHSGLGRGLYSALKNWFNENEVQQILIKTPRYYAVEQAFWRGLGAEKWQNPDRWQTPPGHLWMTLSL